MTMHYRYLFSDEYISDERKSGKDRKQYHLVIKLLHG